jgi:sporulation protein YlmC with PRC-barrel domain
MQHFSKENAMSTAAFPHRILRSLLLPAIGLALPASTLAAGADTAGTAAADYGMSARAQQLWQTLDTNRDGSVSRAEFNAHHGDEFVARLPAQPEALQPTMRASKLIGKDVRHRGGAGEGEIHDLLVDVNTGRIRGAVVSIGGMMNVGDRLYEYPLSAFGSGADGDRLVLNVDAQTVRSARGFDRDNWPYAASTVGDAARARPTESLWRASRLIGRDVEDRNGDHLGEIEDLVIDTRNQRVHSAVLKYDRPWSLDNPLVGLPLSSLQFAPDRENVSMNVDRHRLDEQLVQAHADQGGRNANVIVERWIVFLPADVRTGGASGTAERGQRGATESATAGAANRSPTAATTTATVEFDRLDTNGDGQLSRAEIASASGLPAGFDAMDRNDNQSVSRDEFAAKVTSAMPSR